MLSPSPGEKTAVRLAELVLRRKILVVLFWFVAMIAGGATAGTTVERLAVDVSLTGQAGYETEKQIVEIYGNGPDEGTHVMSVTVPEGTTVASEQAEVDGVFAALQDGFPQFRFAWQGNTGAGGFVTDDGRTSYGIVVHQRFTGFDVVPAFRVMEPVLEEQAAATGFDVQTTGYFQLSEGNAESSDDGQPPSVLSETLLGATGALVVLLFVFASFLALVPLLIAAVAILSTFLCVLAVSYVTAISFVVRGARNPRPSWSTSRAPASWWTCRPAWSGWRVCRGWPVRARPCRTAPRRCSSASRW